MPLLKILVNGEIHRIAFESGRSVREILDATNFRVRSGCHGNGACGLCRVRLIEGTAGPLTASEEIHLHESLRARGQRLACQIRPSADLAVEVLNPAPPSNWRATPEGLWRRGEGRLHDTQRDLPGVRYPCGIAIDLGTTNICLSLFDLAGGHWLADRWGRNPQAAYGSDVVTRLTAAVASSRDAQAMGELVINAVAEALQDIAVREGFDLQRVVWVTLVGNTAMLALLSARNYDALLRPENWERPLDCHPADVPAWIERWAIHPQAVVDVIAPLGGFVGSDLLAGLVATRLIEGVAPALFVDFGTNSEVALWDGGRLYVTSVAGGPAFESGTTFGMPAEPGAIYRVVDEGEALDFRILGDDRAKGVCGSGLVDLIARLRGRDILTETGNFAAGRGFSLPLDGEGILLSKRDVDTFQRAKAAVGVAIDALCGLARIRPRELQRVCVAGAFGRYLDVSSALEVGLLPPIAPERFELVGNSALAGCADLLLSSLAAEKLARMRQRQPEVINLSRYPDFEDAFVENLYLRPLRG